MLEWNHNSHLSVYKRCLLSPWLWSNWCLSWVGCSLYTIILTLSVNVRKAHPQGTLYSISYALKKSYSSVRPGVKIILSELFDNCGAYCRTNGVPAWIAINYWTAMDYFSTDLSEKGQLERVSKVLKLPWHICTDPYKLIFASNLSKSGQSKAT